MPPTAIARLQHRLRALGAYRGLADGRIGPRTEAAVAAALATLPALRLATAGHGREARLRALSRHLAEHLPPGD